MRVRFATPDDAPWLVQSVAQFAREMNAPHLLPADPNVCGAKWLKLIEDHIVIVAHEQDQRFGFIMGWLGAHPFNDDVLTLTEGLWWVDQGVLRANRAGVLLMNAFVEWGEKHCDLVTFTLPNATGARALRRRGFKLEEHTYQKECKR